MNYEKIYNDIISKARSKDRKKIKGGIYYEKHHIIPKCLGGTDDKTNLILLTPKEHYMAHRLLVLIYPKNKKIIYAMWCMINGRGNSRRYIPSSRIYVSLKETHSRFMSNRIVSDDTKKKMSEAARNRPKREVSDETREKLKFARAKRNLTKQPKVKQSRITLTPEEKEQIRILKNSMPRSLKARNKYAQAFYIC